MNIKEIIDDERIDLAMQLDMLSETELNIIDFAFERIEDAVMKHIAELEKRIAELEEVLRWLDIQGSLGYEKHDRIKQVLGGEA